MVTVEGLSEAIKRPPLVARVLRNPLGLVSIVVLGVAVILSAFAGVIAPFDPNSTDLARVMAGPGGGHLLGTDSAGRDIFSRLLYGGQITLAAGALGAMVAMVVGVPAGLIAGYFGGWFDSVASWVSNMFISLPAIVVLLATAAALGPSVWISMTVFGVILSPGFYRLVRTSVIAVRDELYVDAARVAGLSRSRILGRHIFTVVRAPIVIQAALVAGIAIGVQAGLEFLGLGDQTVPSWGSMLNEAFRNVFISPLPLLWTGLAISLVTAAYALLGNALRDALEDDEKAPATNKMLRAARAPIDGATVTEVVEVPTMQGLLEVSDLTVQYPRVDGTHTTVVDSVSFHVKRGEILGLVGESGSGKTQTAFSILGLLPDAAHIAGGHIVFDSTELVSRTTGAVSEARLAPLRGKRIAYIPQEPMSNLDPMFTVGYQLTRPLVKVMGMSQAAARSRALELLAVVGITDPERTFKAYPHEISGGMAQRVLIAGAVSCEPDLLIADEPTTALDVTVQAEVLDLIRNLQSSLGMAVLIVTHNFGVVADLCERVVVMQRARVVEQGTVREILKHPREEYTRNLLNSMLQGKTPLTLLGSPDEVRANAVYATEEEA
ncbi:dipeptide/oligopeptide/nickel ABC transporter permease/ATP-binding protein [Lysinibacter sp. HNR]|uniref:dipeptide/oligopeptide/nickel ABC transporter permease/ATP-binding protein n=1 Tax=Lysinibacter sp. HNR TaxID=3031408 RepID=UPI00243613B8|nr:dipeptide/oligopeptide/nickel ABC transporter permease/ATP-binding protein [Lysinibacter sp. HNR]WGD37291.1 dipeptide/oligopeptide/nickel ABC transporter permease/ATP-binding protein [Lysinibacter sp. HNR]